MTCVEVCARERLDLSQSVIQIFSTLALADQKLYSPQCKEPCIIYANWTPGRSKQGAVAMLLVRVYVYASEPHQFVEACLKSTYLAHHSTTCAFTPAGEEFRGPCSEAARRGHIVETNAAQALHDPADSKRTRRVNRVFFGRPRSQEEAFSSKIFGS